MNMKGLLFIFMLNYLNTIATGGNILVVMPLCFSSHLRSFIPLVEELIKNGHNVTVISKYPMADVQQAKHNHVAVKTNYCTSKAAADAMQNLRHNSRFSNLKVIFEFYHDFSVELINSPELQLVVHSQDHYDLVMAELFFMDIFFAFGYKFNAPVVALCPMNMMYFYSWILGNPYPSSYIPNQLLGYTENMSLFSRISNSVYNAFSVLYYELIHLPKMQVQMEKFFNFDKNDVPNLKDIVKNISLVLVNSHYSVGYIRPELPNVVNIGGLHHPSSKPLPEKMKNFMEEANHGVIYISLGSILQPSHFPELGNTFIRDLKHFPQRVVMKWDPELLTEIPENFFVENWISQTQVLNHPNCRLFISHGGLHSTMEGVNASVPFLGIPLMSDQYYNMAAAHHFGIGRMLQLDEVSSKLSKEVEEVLNNPKYKENMIKRSQLFRDRLAKPLYEAMYWVEHLMKHKNTSHLKSAAVQLTWYEFYGVDVLAILLTLILSVLIAMKLLLAWILKKLYLRIGKLRSYVKQRPEKKDYKCD